MSLRTLTQRTRARVVAAAMQKGGVGKSTTIVNLARAAMLLGLRVLVIDLDPQGNTTDALSISNLSRKQLSIADAILPDSETTLREVIIPTIWSDPEQGRCVDLAPVTSNKTLIKAEALIAATQEGREYCLREALEPVLGDYDLVLIDNAPALGMLLINALNAIDDPDNPLQVLVVMEADRWSTTGLALLRDTINGVQRYTNRTLTWAEVFVSKWRGTRDERDKLAEVQQHFPEARVSATRDNNYADAVPLWAKIKTTLNEGRGLDESPDPRLRITAAGIYERCVIRLMGGDVDAGS